MTKEQRKAWRTANPEKHRAEQRAYYARNRNKIRRRRSERGVNSGYSKVAHALRRSRKTKAGGSFTISEWNLLCRKYNYRCLCCGKRKKLTADHVIPITKGGTSNIDNIQPLCGPCNLRKYTKIIDYRISVPTLTPKGTRRVAVLSPAKSEGF